LVSSACHQILLHLEFEATVVFQKSGIFASIVFGHHQRRLAVLNNTFFVLEDIDLLHLLAASLFVKLGEGDVLGEELMIECLGSVYSFDWVFL